MFLYIYTFFVIHECHWDMTSFQLQRFLVLGTTREQIFLHGWIACHANDQGCKELTDALKGCDEKCWFFFPPNKNLGFSCCLTFFPMNQIEIYNPEVQHRPWLEDYFPIGKVTFEGLCYTSGGYIFEYEQSFILNRLPTHNLCFLHSRPSFCWNRKSGAPGHNLPQPPWQWRSPAQRHQRYASKVVHLHRLPRSEGAVHPYTKPRWYGGFRK